MEATSGGSAQGGGGQWTAGAGSMRLGGGGI